jgi:hypothetical protein
MNIGRAVAKRDIDRVKQHKRHGWYRRDRQPLIAFRPGTVLVECPCGYLGWIDRRVAPPTETAVKAAKAAKDAKAASWSEAGSSVVHNENTSGATAFLAALGKRIGTGTGG